MTANGNWILVTARITWRVAVKLDLTFDGCPSRIPAGSRHKINLQASLRLAAGFGRVIVWGLSELKLVPFSRLAVIWLPAHNPSRPSKSRVNMRSRRADS